MYQYRNGPDYALFFWTRPVFLYRTGFGVWTGPVCTGPDFWYGRFGGFSGPMFFLARMFWGIFRADVFFGTDVLEGFPGRCFFWHGCFGGFSRPMFFFGPQLGLFYGSTGSVRVTGSSGSGSFMTRFPVPGSVRTFPVTLPEVGSSFSIVSLFGQAVPPS